jgi:uncharacterized protein YegL
MMAGMERPGGPLASRPLHFIWIADCSGSMNTGGKIQSLNAAAQEALPQMREVAHDNPNAQVLVRVITFATGAQWSVPDPVPVDRFTWPNLRPGGLTDLGEALSMVARVLTVPPMSTRSLQPVLVLASDGQPTDDFGAGLNDLLSQPWGAKAIRVAIAIGRDANYEVLQQFIGDPNVKPLTANNSAELVDMIRWVSTAPIKMASAPPVAADSQDRFGQVYVPSGVPATADVASTVW